MAKRAVEWPPRATGESSNKKLCCRGSGSMPELSSLLSSLPPHLLLLAKRHCPSAAPHDRRGGKRPRYDDALDSRMRGLQIRCETSKDKEEEIMSTKEEEENVHPCWSSFLPELLGLICRRLSLPDVPRFGAVCKHWNSCAFPVYPTDTAPVLMSITGTGLVRCYSPCFHKIFVLATPLRDPESRIFSATANGRIMLTTPNKTVVLANLLDGSMSETPVRHGDDHGLFMCTPQSSGAKDCQIFGVHANMSSVRIQSWDGESNNWESFEEHIGGVRDEDNDDDDDADMEGVGYTRLFTMSPCCSPVLHKGLLYCLGQYGKLGVYDPREIRWSVLHRPSSFGSDLPYENCYLVESKGELLVVLTGNNGTPPIYVLRLNETEMTWERMESLGGRSLFTGTMSSLSVSKAEDESMANKVYLPRFYGRPEVIQAELATSGDRLFFVAKPGREGQGGDGGAWFYNLESDSGKKMEKQQLVGSKVPLQYTWVQLGIASHDGMDVG